MSKMAYQCFRRRTTLEKKIGTMLEFAITMANIQIMTPFFKEMQNFSFPKSLQASCFCHTQM
jgi:hypothetical protein